MTVKDIKEMALGFGACDLIEGADSLKSLVDVMRTPQGREFCKKHCFPTLDVLRQYKDELAQMNVFVDAGTIETTDVDNVIVAGETDAVIRFKSTDRPYHAIAMHGANAKVIAYGYSICQIVNIGGNIEMHESKNANIYMK